MPEKNMLMITSVRGATSETVAPSEGIAPVAQEKAIQQMRNFAPLKVSLTTAY